MAKIDWNRFYCSSYPTRYFETVDTTVAVGGGTKSLKIGGSGAIDKSTFGFLFNGVNYGDSSILDGSISMAIRTPNNSFGKGGTFIGTIMRAQSLWNGEMIDSDMNYYACGIPLNSYTEGQSTTYLNWFRVINNNVTTLRIAPVTIPIVNNSFIQFETKLVNVVSPSSVEFYLRYNDGTTGSLSTPGSGSEWTSWSLSYTDTSLSKITSGGYWGFGRREDAGFSTSTNQYIYIDQLRIAKGS